MSDKEDADKVRKSFDYINNMLLKSDPYPVTWPYEVGDNYADKIDKIMNGVERDGFFTQEGWKPTVKENKLQVVLEDMKKLQKSLTWLIDELEG